MLLFIHAPKLLQHHSILTLVILLTKLLMIKGGYKLFINVDYTCILDNYIYL